MSLRVMSAGHGHAYLLRSVAAGDGDRRLTEPLVRYYTEKGTPPGRWLGSGVASLDAGIVVGDTVSESQLKLLLGQGRHPVSGEALGRAYPAYASVRERVAARVAQLDPRLSEAERADAVGVVEADEARRGIRRAVAGFDLTFSVPKSVSVLWAVADTDMQARIVRAHHAAIADVVELIERDVAATRIGSAGPDGAVSQADVTGVIATAFDHWDSRAGDPQLHTHVVLSNKVRTVRDGEWRALDGRPLHAALVAVSEHYNALLADRLSREIGVEWERRERGPNRNPAWEITGVPDELAAAFSSRSAVIAVETERLIDAYRATHGRRPGRKTIVRLRAQATLATRSEKVVRPLRDLTAGWRTRAGALLGVDATAWARTVTGLATEAVRAERITTELVGTLAQLVVRAVEEKRAVWTRWNLHAETSRQTAGTRFASTADREAAIGLIVDAAEQASLRLTPPELASTPANLRRADGTSMLRPRNADRFTSTELLNAEARLMHHARTVKGPRSPVAAFDRGRPGQAPELGEDQRAALLDVATSGRVVDVLVGAAGSGKTTALSALRHAWERTHGSKMVVGLAPSATTAAVLAAELDMPCENTAKWLHEHHACRWAFRRGQLVIVDEASLAGTHTLDTIASHAALAGAKVLLVGDWAQLDAIDAGGAFGLLVRDRGDPPELTGIRRFHQMWERDASRRLRRGDTGVLSLYEQHGRIVEGSAEHIGDAAYSSWRADVAAGRRSIMIAETTETVTSLNMRARLDRIITGEVNATREVALHDGTHASPGDLIVTRHNDRRLTYGRDWVRNGDAWAITRVGTDGSLTVRRLRGKHRMTRTSVRLPADYVGTYVELGYAATIRRAQGATVDTAHAIVAKPSMTREALYVAMTRARLANIVYVATDQAHLEEHQQVPDEDAITAHTVLAGILARIGREASAHETLGAEQERWSSIAQLAAEYDTIATEAQRERWTTLIRSCGLTDDQTAAVIASPAFDALAVALRRAEGHRYDVDTLLPRLVARRSLVDAEDIAAVLHKRLTTATPPRRGKTPRLIAGLIPTACGALTSDMRTALDERRQLIENRARALAYSAIRDRSPWTYAVGHPPTNPERRRTWLDAVTTIAAYRDRHRITTTHPIGSASAETTNRHETATARTALDIARTLSQTDRRSQPTTAPKPPDRPVATPTL